MFIDIMRSMQGVANAINS